MAVVALRERFAVQEFLEKGFMTVPFDPGDLPNRIFTGFQQLRSEDPLYQRAWNLEPAEHKPDHGFFIRSSAESGGKNKLGEFQAHCDDKTLYHHRLWDSRRHPGVLLPALSDDIGRYRDWLEACDEIQMLGLECLHRFTQALDQEVHDRFGVDFQFTRLVQDRDAKKLHLMRLIAYHPKPKGENIGDAHYDWSGLTLAVKESAPGLWMHNNSQILPYRDASAVVFPGRKIGPVTGGTKDSYEQALIKPVLHGSESRNDNSERLALILFFHFPGDLMGPEYKPAP